MRILAINTVPTDKNGITNVIFNLYRAMDKQNVTFDYVSINAPASSYAREIEAADGQIFVINRSMRRVVTYICSLRDVIRQGKYDVVHAHGNSATLALEMLAAKLAGCKVRIAHSHNTTCLSKTVHKLLTPLFRGCCTHYLACGEDAGKWLYGKKPFSIVNNGVDTARFAFQAEARKGLRAQYGIGEDLTVIGHVGAFNEAKNQGFIIDILDELTRANGNYLLMLLGEGPLFQRVSEKVHRLGLTDRVIFAGTTDRVEDYLSACDLIVMPSLFEGLPLSLIEEQANGLQCVVSENITREVDKTGNLSFLSLDVGAAYWAQVIQQISAENNREERSRAAIERIKACGYDIRTEAAALLLYYQQALRGE